MTVAEPSTGYSLEDGPLRPGVRAGSYLIERRLGSGGMGAVYAATHVGLDKPVALKALHRTFAVQEKSVKRFVREGRAASRIRHPHVVDVTDVGSHDGIPFLVMEMLDGEDLEQHLDRCGSLALPRLVQIMLPVIDAVATAHDAGVVHRDLKPSNIFLARDGRGNEVPKVLDFGIARMLHEQGKDRIRLTQQGAFVGTPYYASPEQATNGSAADARSDQYSIGAILYQLASGELPVKGKTPFEVLTAIVCGEITPFNTLRDTWHPGLVEVVERSMRFEATERYADLRELGRALLTLADDDVYARFRGAFGAPLRNRSPMAYEATHQFGAAGPDGSLPGGPAVAQLRADAASPHRASGVLPETRAALPRVQGPAPSFIAPAVAAEATAPRRSGRGAAAFLVLAAVALLGAGLGSYLIYANRAPAVEPVASAPETVLLRVTPATATIELDGEPVGVGSATLPADDGESHRLRVAAEGFETVEREITPGGSPTSLVLAASPVEAAARDVLAEAAAPDETAESDDATADDTSGEDPEDEGAAAEAATESAHTPDAGRRGGRNPTTRTRGAARRHEGDGRTRPEARDRTAANVPHPRPAARDPRAAAASDSTCRRAPTAGGRKQLAVLR